MRCQKNKTLPGLGSCWDCTFGKHYDDAVPGVLAMSEEHPEVVPTDPDFKGRKSLHKLVRHAKKKGESDSHSV